MGLYFLKAVAKKKKANLTSFHRQQHKWNHKNPELARHSPSYHSSHRYDNQANYFFHVSPFTLLFPIIMLLHASVGVQADITVTEYGVRSIKPGDTALVFYANASHTGTKGDLPIAARLYMEKCCLLLPPNRTSYCDSMKLISGLGIILHPKQAHTLQMYFLNFDLYDREGSCVLRLLTKLSPKSRGSKSLSSAEEHHDSSWTKGNQLTIEFKTKLPKPSVFKKLFSGSSEGYKICNSDNYNALHECSNYDDCLIRHSGARSLFSTTSKECTPTPECTNSDTNFLSIVTKMCEKAHDSEHAQKSYTFEMKLVKPPQYEDAISTMNQPHHFINLQSQRNASKATVVYRSNIVCVHGVRTIDEDGRHSCTCQSGWRSLTLEEWVQRGGIVNSHDEGPPFHRMCTVDLMDSKARGYLLLGFVGICVLIPFIAMLMCNMSKNGEDEQKKRRSSVKKFLEEEGSSGEDNNSNNADLEKKGSNTPENRPSSHEMEEDEAKNIISEVANRREPQLPRTPSKVTDNNLSPSTKSPAETSRKASARASQETMPSAVPTQSSWSVFGNSTYDQNPPQQQQKILPLTTSPAITTPLTLPKSTQYSPTASTDGSTVMLKQLEIKHFFSPSGFDLSRQGSEVEDKLQANRTNNNNNNNNQTAAQAPSMDDLLSLSKHEKIKAHEPMYPKTMNEKRVSIVVANCSSVELLENNVILHSMSSEEITQRKKEEWDQFIKSVSKTDISIMKPEHTSISLAGEERTETENNNTVIDGFREEEEEQEDGDDEEVEVYSRTENYQQSHPPDFAYFHKDHKPRALKVRSVPGMMQYHPFSTLNATLFPATHSTQVQMPEPPPLFVQKAFENLSQEELISRQECYRILSSLSSERVSSVEEVRRNPSSIWSNVASENTNEPTTSASWKNTLNSVDDENVSLRTNPIYGDMGSDVDSDGALEILATSQQNSEDKEKEKKEQIQQLASNAVDRENQNTQANLLNLESDAIPSDVYMTDSDAGASRLSSRTSLPGMDFWKFVMSGASGGGGGTNVGDESTEASTVDGINSETSSAYRIKSSLESVLKASRSRSGTNLF